MFEIELWTYRPGFFSRGTKSLEYSTKLIQIWLPREQGSLAREKAGHDNIFMNFIKKNYCRNSNISHTLAVNKIVDHSDVVVDACTE